MLGFSFSSLLEWDGRAGGGRSWLLSSPPWKAGPYESWLFPFPQASWALITPSKGLQLTSFANMILHNKKRVNLIT